VRARCRFFSSIGCSRLRTETTNRCPLFPIRCPQRLRPVRSHDNSPAIHRREGGFTSILLRPVGTAESSTHISHRSGPDIPVLTTVGQTFLFSPRRARHSCSHHGGPGISVLTAVGQTFLSAIGCRFFSSPIVHDWNGKTAIPRCRVIPKGLNKIAQGCRAAATLGQRPHIATSTLKGLHKPAPPPQSPRCGPPGLLIPPTRQLLAIALPAKISTRRVERQ
jgi:hypothetical protein